MPTATVSAALPAQIQRLLEQREQHSAALASIEETLSRITAALGGTALKAIARKAPAGASAPKRRGRPKGTSSGVTANDFVVGFVRDNKNPTSQEINKAWKDGGRNGTADNALSVLTKAGKLKRVPLGVGIRGSRYTVG